MEGLLGKTIYGAVFGILFYIGWFHILPFLRKKKEALVKKTEEGIEKHGFSKYYKIAYKTIKVSLYILLSVLVLIPLSLILIGMLSSK